MEKFGAQNLKNEITKDGLGADFYNELNGPKGTVSTEEFLKWVFVETRGASLLERFENMFTSVEVIEHYSNSFKIKVSKDNFSIGYLFGMMEDVKNTYSISEYSVSQTTLEQIFNNFAKEAESGAGNARKRTTVATKKLKKQGSSGKLEVGGIRLKSEMRGATETLDNSGANFKK